MNKVIIYTDGACRGNPGVGGWGVVLTIGQNTKELKGGEMQTTNNQMELKAAIEALASLKKSCQVALYTDSVYVRSGILQWIKNWKKNAWKTAARKSVKNQHLWRQLDDLTHQHEIEWFWVKGHAGNKGNERADALANLAIDELLQNNQ